MPSVLDQSQRPPTQYLARAPLFFHFFNGVTPTSWGDPARDFPLFPLVRYPLRRNSAISATPLPRYPLSRGQATRARPRGLYAAVSIFLVGLEGAPLFSQYFIRHCTTCGRRVRRLRFAAARSDDTSARGDGVPETRTNRQKCRCHRHRAVHARWTIVDSSLT